MLFPDELIKQMVMFGPWERVWTGLGRLGATGVEPLLVMLVTAAGAGVACLPTIQAFAPASFYLTTQGS